MILSHYFKEEKHKRLVLTVDYATCIYFMCVPPTRNHSFMWTSFYASLFSLLKVLALVELEIGIGGSDERKLFLLLFFFFLSFLLKTDFVSPWCMDHHCWKLYIRVGRKILFLFFFFVLFFPNIWNMSY